MAYDDVNMEEMAGAIQDDTGEIVDDSSDTGEVASSQPQQQQASQQPQQQTAQQPSGQPQPVWNGQEWQLKYRGNPYVPKSREELVSLAQRGFSYSQEMEKINRERAQYNEQLNTLKSQYGHYDKFDNLLKSNPALAERIMQVAQEYQSQPGKTGNGQVDHRVYGELTNRLQQLESQNSERINSEYDRKLADSLATIRKQYPSHDWEYDDGNGNLEKQLLQFAYDNGITNLDHAYRAMMWDSNSTNAKADALKQQAAKTQQATRAGVINKTVSAGSGNTRAGYKYGDTYGDLAKRMADEIKT